MKRISFTILLISIMFAGGVEAAMKSSTVALICDTSRVHDKGQVQFSLVFNETERSILLNGSPVGEPTFTPYKVSGKNRFEDASIAGVSKEVSVSLDRVTGKFSLMTLPVATNGGEFTEDQKTKITSKPFDPIFIGSCELSKPKF